MIRTITAGFGVHIGNAAFAAPYIDASRTNAGMVRYTNSNFEIYDGSMWIPIANSYPQIELSADVQTIINWARDKMNEEQRLQELAKTNPTVADALASRDRADEAVRIAMALCDVK